MRADSYIRGRAASLFLAGLGVVLAVSGAAVAWQALAVNDAERAVRAAAYRSTTAPPTDADRRRLEALRAALPAVSVAADVDALALELWDVLGPEKASREGTRRHARAMHDGAIAHLGHAPLSARGWCIAAEAALLLEGPSAAAQRALAQCRHVAPRDVAVLAQRIRTGVMMWEALDAEGRKRTLADVEQGLREEGVAPWLVEDLARFSAVATPDQSSLVAGMVRAYAATALRRFDEVVAGRRAQLQVGAQR